MAKRTDFPVDRDEGSESQVLPYRPVLDWPTSFFIGEVLAHLRASAQPETSDLLFRNRIEKNTKFKIVRKVHLDQRKRPEADRAPCPMCTTNRFLSGALVYLPELMCCAVIGHCCAGKEERDEAEREYKQRTQRDFEESLLLNALPIMPQKLDVLAKLRPAAEEARRIYRKFRKEAPSAHGHLRELKARRGGYLSVTELRSAQEDDIQIYGPKGFDRRSGEQTREIEFGIFGGQIAVNKDYNPVRELENIVRIATSLNATPSEEKAVEFIISMTDTQRRAAVAIVEGVDDTYTKFIARLTDFTNFFGAENIGLINAYGNHQSNPFPIETKRELVKGGVRVRIRHRGELCQMLIGPQLFNINFQWPEVGR